jgi:carbon monoxide dehydrogenase subunit G
VQLEHSFDVPVGIDEAWRILLDIERIGPCMPGAAIDSVDGDDFTGTVKVKLGPINLTYKGKASFVEKDEAAHRAVIDARGRDARGNGTAAAKVTATLVASSASSTTVKVNTDLDITGKPAQFGRGVMVDVGNKLIGQFADSLAGTIAAGDGGTAAAAGDGPPASSAAAPATPSKASRAKPVGAPTPAEEPVASAPTEEPVASAQADEPAPTSGDQAPAAEAETTEAETTGDETTGDGPSFAVPDELPAAAPEDLTSVNGHASSGPQPPRDVEPINLLESAGPAVAKRLAPVAVALVVVLLAARRRRSLRA